jgi:ribosomal protein S18 acetylase RimI-like enzyme
MKRMTTTEDLADRATNAFFDMLARVTAVNPRSRMVLGDGETMMLVTGTLIPGLNGVFSWARDVDIDQVGRFAELVSQEGLPWSIGTRVEPPAGLVEIAGRYGRGDRNTEPLMVCRAGDVRLGEPRRDGPVIRAITSADLETYVGVMSSGLGAPAEVVRGLVTAPVVDVGWTDTYLAELDGVPVATGFGVRSGDHIGVFNIVVLPEFRRRGYGRSVTERIMRDGFERGARVAYLHSSPEGLPLYRSMGFRTVETWTYFS